MTEFIKAVEGYYGPYRKGTKDVVLKYLQEENIHPEQLRKLWRHLVKSVSGQYSFSPDVATIEQARREIWSSRPSLPEYKPVLPEPEAEDFRPQLGGMLKGLVEKMSQRRQREEVTNE